MIFMTIDEISINFGSLHQIGPNRHIGNTRYESPLSKPSAAATQKHKHAGGLGPVSSRCDPKNKFSKYIFQILLQRAGAAGRP